MAVKALQDILDRIESWPAERQERAAELLSDLEGSGHSSWELSDEQVTEIRRRLVDTSEPTLTLEELDQRLRPLIG